MSDNTDAPGGAGQHDFSLIDPKGLFKDVYSMDGITAGECRSVFLDWAISGRVAGDEQAALATLYAHYGPQFPGHPMTEVLRQATEAPAQKPTRRGGVRGRNRN